VRSWSTALGNRARNISPLIFHQHVPFPCADLLPAVVAGHPTNASATRRKGYGASGTDREVPGPTG
jgi:hypothetical protein